MSLKQGSIVVPPNPIDTMLKDYTTVIQNNMVTLYQAAHNHVGSNGPITTVPGPNDGNIGDIYIAEFTTSQKGPNNTFAKGDYLFFKTGSGWFGLGPATKV
jgi:hypothetical protein